MATTKKRGRPAKIKEIATPTEQQAVPTESPYTLEVVLADKVYTASAPTMLEALKSLVLPHKITTKGLIVVHHGERSKELFFMPAKLKRVFYPNSAIVMAKMLAMNV